MIDFVIPNGNEEQFILMAIKLGYDSLCFVYDKEVDISKYKNDKIKVYYGIIHNDKNKYRIKPDFVLAQSSEQDRSLIEQKKANIIFGFEESAKRDKMHQRFSGLNQVFAQMMHDKGIAYGIDFNTILKSGAAARAQILGRIKQNIVLMRKYKLKTVLASFASNPFEMRSPHDMASFAVSLGMHPKEAKDALNIV